MTASADVTNTGSRADADTAQLYVGDTAATGEPPRQLKGFQKVWLAPGQTKLVTFQLDPESAFASWDTRAGRWTVADGSYRIMLGDSSASLPLASTVRITGT